MAQAAHRVIEFCSGRQLFGGDESHFTWRLFGPLPKLPDNSPSDPALMAAAGTAIGAVHAMPVTWLSSVASTHKLKKCLASPMLFPAYIKDLPPAQNAIVERVRHSVVLPATGLFNQPCCCHMDLHGGNMIVTEDRLVRIIDWESVSIGHRGQDLSYFFMNSPGSTPSPRSWSIA